MIKCNNCGYTYADNLEKCPACGAVAKEEISEAADVELDAADLAGYVEFIEKVFDMLIEGEDNDSQEEDDEEEEADEILERESIISKYVDFIDVKSLYKIACCYYSGAGLEKNVPEAMKLFRILAMKAHLESMNKLGEIYFDMGDEEEARKWFSLAAARGHQPSTIRLHTDFGEPITTINPETPASPDSPTVTTPGVEPKESSGGGFSENAAAIMPHVVKIQSNHGMTASTGAGFIVDGGYVITNAHVIGKKYSDIVASFDESIDDVVYFLKPLAIYHDYDVAILEFSGVAQKRFAERKNLELYPTVPKHGETVFTVGNPLGVGLSFNSGYVSAPSRETQIGNVNMDAIQVSIVANHGNSGGAVFDIYNRVIGMLTCCVRETANGITMCIPASEIIALLNKTIKK